MPPFRMPFSSRKGPVTNGLESINDENARPGSNGVATGKDSVGLGLRSARVEPNEYKMSSVNDSGIYLPPSPTEKKSFWHRTPTSTSSSNHRSLLAENEPFSISRESFESYRRSFVRIPSLNLGFRTYTAMLTATATQDISGRSPVLQGDSLPSRTSLDSRAMRLPRSSVNGHTFEKPQSTEEEEFEDVGLQDEPKLPPKRKGFMSRFGESASSDGPGGTGGEVSKSHFSLHLPGRKRGQSGQGAELGSIDRPGSKGKVEATVR